MDNSIILHHLADFARELLNIDEPRLLRTRDRIQDCCNKIWTSVTKEDCHGIHQ